MAGIWHRLFGNREPDEKPMMSPEVRQALDDSAKRLRQAKRIRNEVEQQMAPVNKALERNGFEPAVRATFVRRQA